MATFTRATRCYCEMELAGLFGAGKTSFSILDLKTPKSHFANSWKSTAPTNEELTLFESILLEMASDFQMELSGRDSQQYTFVKNKGPILSETEPESIEACKSILQPLFLAGMTAFNIYDIKVGYFAKSKFTCTEDNLFEKILKEEAPKYGLKYVDFDEQCPAVYYFEKV